MQYQYKTALFPRPEEGLARVGYYFITALM
jgi:hypothetical protein